VGASGGIGTAAASALAAADATVVLSGRRDERLAELAAALGPAVTASQPADLSTPGACARLVRAASDALGGLDVVVNCAGHEGPVGPVTSIEPAAWDETILANLTSGFYLARAALPQLEASPAGVLIVVSSVVGQRAWPGYAALSAAKAGLEQLTRVIAIESAAAGVRAVCVAPGVVDAGMTDRIVDPDLRRTWAMQHPLGRMAAASEVADAIVWLASNQASFVTGTTIQVDGGWSA
jgi:NAD(P)-dependent dehydrogenase (short-subunit alcohol dehydrogenase family)